MINRLEAFEALAAHMTTVMEWPVTVMDGPAEAPSGELADFVPYNWIEPLRGAEFIVSCAWVRSEIAFPFQVHSVGRGYQQAEYAADRFRNRFVDENHIYAMGDIDGWKAVEHLEDGGPGEPETVGNADLISITEGFRWRLMRA
jgi:hypothetical protein